jgi:hypothetical protein
MVPRSWRTFLARRRRDAHTATTTPTTLPRLIQIGCHMETSSLIDGADATTRVRGTDAWPLQRAGYPFFAVA